MSNLPPADVIDPFAGTPAAPPPPAAPPAPREVRWPHLAWDGVLVAALAATVAVLWTTGNRALPGSPDLAAATLLGFLPYLLTGMSVAVSLRAGVPNLAAAGTVFLSATAYAVVLPEAGTTIAVLAAAGVAVAATLLIAGCVTLLRVPAWAACLGTGAAAVTGAAWWRPEAVSGLGGGWAWGPVESWTAVGAAVALSLLGGVAMSFTSARVRLRRAARVAAAERGTGGAGTLWTVVLVSQLLAAAAGVMVFAPEAPVLQPGFGAYTTLTFLAFGMTLLGGTGLYGARGGFVGTVTAGVLILGVARHLPEFAEIVPAVALLVGIPVARLVGGPAPAAAAVPDVPEPATTTVPLPVVPVQPVAPPAEPPPVDTAETLPVRPAPAAPFDADTRLQQYWPTEPVPQPTEPPPPPAPVTPVEADRTGTPFYRPPAD
ncbi:ribose/xylose/arabinose/galactoside ABC-type transport system permease subunit [Stackebrandtia albiflava]|uniref:Ribose/xylose/arabinose/galactoside ABC-type transport system permease subunit n=1 Tax=Stackebrandtia albiflava TaxID=406432 RepID=A0A562UYL7_9ACTN|nr:hypothetical protein [Stackebrandtia albiflava]TWJ10706.1 ribose/xylose/arabinose/galactoside ABC-type transport system permease subunit [Stackebrandtia albiflava]